MVFFAPCMQEEKKHNALLLKSGPSEKESLTQFYHLLAHQLPKVGAGNLHKFTQRVKIYIILDIIDKCILQLVQVH